MTIHDDLRALREAAKMPQAKLARQIGLSPGMISLVETGRRETSTVVVERWVDACRGRLLLLPCGVNDLATLTSEERRLVELWRGGSGELRQMLTALLDAGPGMGGVAIQMLLASIRAAAGGTGSLPMVG